MTPQLRRLYLDLLKAAVRNSLYRDDTSPPGPDALARAEAHLERMRKRFGDLVEGAGLDAAEVHQRLREKSLEAHTLADAAQLENVQSCIEAVLADGVPGHLIEAGAFRGGVTVLMRGVLKAYGVTDRRVLVADTFEGLPEPDPTQRFDVFVYEFLRPIGQFRVSEEEVRATFARYDLLDDQVCFLKGPFRDTLPVAPHVAVVRLDCDWYESTCDALTILYPKLAPGGFVIVDDYRIPVGGRRAVDEFRMFHGITEPLIPVNRRSVYWRRAR